MGLPQPTTTPALDACRAAEEKLRQVQQLLLDPDPENLETGLTELSEVSATLETLISAGSQDWSPAMPAALRQLKRASDDLRTQIEHASHFWLGWLQLCLGIGYTEQGRPAFVDHEARSCFEG
jgi:hypothetical protein